MKTKIFTLAIVTLWSVTSVFAQDRTTVTATNSDISDNLDLRAVASIFGDSKDLNDFEQRLNDPKAQISNLDLNGDNQVDYLRVIESVEGNAHLIIIQSVLGRETFQDIATIEVDRDSNNRVQVQVVGDVYMYGSNYIYEPVYSYAPPIYTSFWVGNYRPYYSSWYWDYYPTYYSFWAPYPIYTYHNHIHVHINSHHHYNYVNNRRNTIVYNNYYSNSRQNGYERQYPNRSFIQRNVGYTNRRELTNSRNTQTNSRGQVGSNGGRSTTGSVRSTRNVTSENRTRTQTTSSPRSVTTQNGTRNTESPKSVSVQNGSRNHGTQFSPRNNESPRTQTTPRNVETPRAQNIPQKKGNTRSSESQRIQTPRNPGSSAGPQSTGSSSRSEGNSSVARR